jgi:hypothetical protein
MKVFLKEALEKKKVCTLAQKIMRLTEKAFCVDEI